MRESHSSLTFSCHNDHCHQSASPLDTSCSHESYLQSDMSTQRLRRKQMKRLGLIGCAIVTASAVLSNSASSFAFTPEVRFSQRSQPLSNTLTMPSHELCPSFITFEEFRKQRESMTVLSMVGSHGRNPSREEKRKRKVKVSTSRPSLVPLKMQRMQTAPLRRKKKQTDTSDEPAAATTTTKPSSNTYIQKETIDFLLHDDDEEDDDADEANQIADKSNFSKMSDEAKFKATVALKWKGDKSLTAMNKPTKVRASVQETGNDTMSQYIKNMGSHELLRKEDEVILGRHVQILVKWDEIRMDLEDKLMRTPTFAEWANAVDISVPELKKQIRRSQRAKAALVEANLRLVVSLARQSIKSGNTEISFQDACQEGIIGLTKACDKFDPEKGFRFSTYANWYIKRHINENVLDQGRTVKLPYRVALKINKIKITEVTLKDELGRAPTDEEVADKLEMTVENLNFYRQKSQKAFSLDKSVTSKSGKGSSASTGGQGERGSALSVSDTIRDPSSNPTELVSNEMLQNDVRRLLTTLSPREQAVIRLRFGVDDGKPRTVSYIAQKFNVSPDKIKKVETRALQKLKQPYRSNSVKCYISDL